MSRVVELHQSAVTLSPTPKQIAMLSGFLQREVEDALAARGPQETLWREVLRLYEGVPRNPVRNTPIENAPNIEITLGAIASDALYAQAIDTIFAVQPFVTTQAVGNSKDDIAKSKALQRWTNFVVDNELGVRQATEHAILDNVQIGTGVYYTPWIEDVKKTKVAKIRARGPRMRCIPPEDFLVPGGADADLQAARWCAFREYLTDDDIALERKLRGWDTEGFAMVGSVGWVRSRREMLGRTTSTKFNELYEIWRIFAHYDLDDDGIGEDIMVVWDRTSTRVGKVLYNPYDHRPFDAMRYQLRAHLFYGIGALEMLRPYQEEVTELHNDRVLNVKLANARIWKAKTGQAAEGARRIWPNKVIELDDPESLQPEQMGDIYPSIAQAEAITVSLAERRVGVNELNLPRPSQVLGSRTPGITALSLLQQVNRRFTPAFDSIRLALAGAVRQALWRYQERLLLGDTGVEDHILSVLGETDGRMVIELLKDEHFDESVRVQLTASSATVNREVERQNAMMLVNILVGYYSRVLELMTISSNPQTPQPVRDVAKKIAEAGGEIIERTIRTFDSVRDPQRFIIDVEAEMDSMPLAPEGLSGLATLFQNFATAGTDVAPGA